MNSRLFYWRHLRALNELYVKKRTAIKIADNQYINNYLVKQRGLIKPKMGNIKIMEAKLGFAKYYEVNLLSNFNTYWDFLSRYNLEEDSRKVYSEDDLIDLLFIENFKGDLLKTLSTVRTFSARIFKSKGSKYLENHTSLLNAVYKILGIEQFPEKDPKNLQWRLVVDCLYPKAIILCENIAHLKHASRARENNLELWYVGGNNTAIIDEINAEKLVLPIYYSCDWDYHGLKIFSSIKTKILLKGTNIRILKPHLDGLELPVDSPYHNSQWKNDKNFQELIDAIFTENEISLIRMLIKNNSWIEEESMDLIELLEANILLQVEQ